MRPLLYQNLGLENGPNSDGGTLFEVLSYLIETELKHDQSV